MATAPLQIQLSPDTILALLRVALPAAREFLIAEGTKQLTALATKNKIPVSEDIARMVATTVIDLVIRALQQVPA